MKTPILDPRGLVLRTLLAGLLLCCSGLGLAASKATIDARIRASLSALYEEYPEARELVAQAKGILVFPQVFKAGFILGGEYGEGALLIGGRPVQYYRTAGLSLGAQAGAQGKAQVVMFMNDEVLAKFRQSRGWEAGVDGSIAVTQFGTAGSLNTRTIREPIVGFVFSNRGLMLNASFAGSKFWKIEKKDPQQVAPAAPPPPRSVDAPLSTTPPTTQITTPPTTSEAPVESSAAW
ncbi:MAG: YSC84-related protein [Pseudomonadota bacterium]